MFSAVAKCTTNYYAIIYDPDHSEHIKDHLIRRWDNGATCLNCKVDFFFLLEMDNCCISFAPSSPTLLKKCKACESVTHVHSFTLPVLTLAQPISPYLLLFFPV